MQTKMLKSFKHKPYRTYMLSSQDIQKGRRDAYQKWCPHPIDWDKYKELETLNKLQLNVHNSSQKNESDYWKKFIKE
jgi:hypothetical protein